MRMLFWHPESECLFESSNSDELSMDIEDVTGLPEWEARFQEEQNTMTDEQFDKIYKLFSDGLGRLNHTVQVMAEATVQIEHNLGRLASAGGNSSPNYFKRLSDFQNFDWSSINADVIERDRDGVSVVEWEGRMFTRRKGNADYDPALFFTVCTGKDEAGKNKYDRLITFKQPSKAKRVPEETKELVEKEQPRQQTQQTASQPPNQRPEPPKGDGVACSLPSWDALTKVVQAAGKEGVMPDNWKPRVKSVVGSDDMRSLGDADIAKAISVIKGLVETRQLASRSADVA